MRSILTGALTFFFILSLLSLTTASTPNMQRRKDVNRARASLPPLPHPSLNVSSSSTVSQSSTSTRSSSVSGVSPSSTIIPHPSSTSSTPSPTPSSAPAPSSSSSVAPPTSTSTPVTQSTPAPSLSSTPATTPTISAPVISTISSSTSSVPPLPLSSFPAVAPAPVTTIIVIPTTSTILPGTATSVTSKATGFFAHTGAVAGTFTVVGLVIVGLLAASLFLVCKKRRSASDDEDEAYFEKIAAPGTPAPGGAAHNMFSPVSVYPTEQPTAYAQDAFAEPSNVADHNYGYQSQPQGYQEVHQYQPDYPPGTAYVTQDHGDGPYALQAPVTTHPHPYGADPFISRSAREHTNLDAVSHDSDSFYGAT